MTTSITFPKREGAGFQAHSLLKDRPFKSRDHKLGVLIIRRDLDIQYVIAPFPLLLRPSLNLTQRADQTVCITLLRLDERHSERWPENLGNHIPLVNKARLDTLVRLH